MFFLGSTIIVSLLVSILARIAAEIFFTDRVSVIGSFVGLELTQNPGVAFGIRFPEQFQTVIILCALVAVGWLALHSAQSSLSQIGFGLILGGAFANILDRLGDGYVTDFIQVGTFPLFNIADSCITIGVVILLIEAWWRWRYRL